MRTPNCLYPLFSRKPHHKRTVHPFSCFIFVASHSSQSFIRQSKNVDSKVCGCRIVTGIQKMGSFKGHALPGTLFLVVGAWHLWSGIRRYVEDPVAFRVRTWNPVEGLGERLRHLELYVVAGGAFLDMCIELLYSTHLRWFVDGELNPAHLNDFEHGGMLFMFFLFGAVALISQQGWCKPLPEGALCTLAATAFTSEYVLFYFHSTNHKGLEGYYHFLLVILIGLCIAATVAGALLPTSFMVDLTASIAITLQGLWFYQTAFTLYGPMMPKGCELTESMIMCHLHGSELRGELLANFQFFSLVVAVFVATVGLYFYAASKYGHPQLKSYVEGGGGVDDGVPMG